MRRFKLISALSAAVLAAVLGCSKSEENLVAVPEDGMIKLSLTGELGEYATDVDTKGQLVNSVRVEWSKTDKVYVYDASQCLGELSVVPTTDGKSADLNGTINAPAEGTTVLTFVSGSSFTATKGDKLTDGRIEYDLSNQDGDKAPYMVYGTLPYSSMSFKNQRVQFTFATSVIRVNCTGLWTDGESSITESFVTGLNNVCVITVSGDGAPEINGETMPQNDTIVRRGLTSSAKIKKAGGDIDSGTGTFSIAVVPTNTAADRRLVMTITDKSNGEHYRGAIFTDAELTNNVSYNTVLHLGEMFKVTARSSNAAWGTVCFNDGSQGESTCRYLFPGDEATLVAQPKDSYFFNAWRNDDEFQKVASPTAEWLLKDVASNMAVVAKFTETYEPSGMLAGLFSIAPNHQVYFASGNVMYHSPDAGGDTPKGLETDVWEFHTNQYDCVGKAGNQKAPTIQSAQMHDSIDIFRYGCTNDPAWRYPTYPTSTTGTYPSTSNLNKVKYHIIWEKPSGTMYAYNEDLSVKGTKHSSGYSDKLYHTDWGWCFGGEDSQWRTLSAAEWSYLLGITIDGYTYATESRCNNEAHKHFGLGTVHNIYGIIVFPDDMAIPDGFKTYFDQNTSYAVNTISESDWNNLEKNGTLFLPLCGYDSSYYYSNSITDINKTTVYWTSTGNSTQSSYAVYFDVLTTKDKNVQIKSARHYAASAVRLVFDPSVGK